MKTREKSLSEWVFVAIGGAAGALARAGLDALAELFPYSGVLASFMLLPWSTLLANLGGAFFLGALSAFLTRKMELTPQLLRLRLLAATGLAGAFTTYGSLIAASGMAMIRTPNVTTILSAAAASLLLLLLGVISAAGGWGLVKKLARVAETQRIGTMKRKAPSKDAEVCETGGLE
ncbi:hypothetical protein HMPREF9004_1045 [Schaalia cardiffensis F0333]|uniref:Fluoride-specific ion channel n=1 Tax=Schaalia cardiffensis F0333 TaxID=888050 RepID=N6WDB7_9ACTO|nr:hypothetical protein HMPREF9004_1045 [Schaalia cardiffensis F0333]